MIWKVFVGLVSMLLVCIFYFLYKTSSHTRYFRLSNDVNMNQSLDLPIMLGDISKNESWRKATKYHDTTYLSFDSFGNIDNIMSHMLYPYHVKFIYGINGSDLLAGKDRLAERLKGCKWIPETWVTSSEPDMLDLVETFDEKAVYIAKKNVQRQSGLLLFKDKDLIPKIKQDYVVVQKMLQNPLLISLRKINIRMYLLVKIDKESKTDMYMYPGFVYYTPDAFAKNSMSPSECITTGYIDRAVYVENALTVPDMAKQIGQDKYDLMLTNTREMMSYVAKVFQPILSKANTRVPGVKFSIFGCDVAIDDEFNVSLIEINKGPSLDPHDDRDATLKLDMVRSAHEIAGIIPSNGQGGWIPL